MNSASFASTSCASSKIVFGVCQLLKASFLMPLAIEIFKYYNMVCFRGASIHQKTLYLKYRKSRESVENIEVSVFKMKLNEPKLTG